MLFRSGLDRIIVQPEDVKKYLGVKHGVDMTIWNNNKIVGGIGITGKPEEVMSIITIAKISLETMLDYEMFKEANTLRNNEWDEFCNLLLKSDSKDTSHLHQLAQRQLINTALPHFAVVFDLLDDDRSLIHSYPSSWAASYWPLGIDSIPER